MSIRTSKPAPKTKDIETGVIDHYTDGMPMLMTETRLDGQGMRLLLVEDQPSDVFLAEELLEEGMPDYQWRIVNKSSMANALSIVRHVMFDVALLDLTLDDMDGAGAVAILQAAAPNLPIVIYSGTRDRGLLDEAVRNGARDCIEKGNTTPDSARAIIRGALASEATY